MLSKKHQGSVLELCRSQGSILCSDVKVLGVSQSTAATRKSKTGMTPATSVLPETLFTFLWVSA